MRNLTEAEKKKQEEQVVSEAVEETLAKIVTYQSIIPDILHLIDEDKEKYKKHLNRPTPEEIQNILTKKQNDLWGTMSNCDSRITPTAAVHPKMMIRQIFWNYFREFSIDYIYNATKTEFKEDFFIKLGVMRNVFHKFKYKVVNAAESDLKSLMDLKEIKMTEALIGVKAGSTVNHILNYPFGKIYLFPDKTSSNNDAMEEEDKENMTLSPDTTLRTESVYKNGAYSSVFDKLNELIHTNTHKLLIYYPHHYDAQENLPNIHSNIEIPSNIKSKLLEALRLLQKQLKHTEIYIHRDRFNGYLISTIESPRHDEKIEQDAKTDPAMPSCQIRKFYVTKEEDEKLVALPLGSVTAKNDKIVCKHYGLSRSDWKSILVNALNRLRSLPADSAEEKEHFLKALGEFCHLYINIMPYIFGSAAIGEWLMYGIAKSRGINLAPLDSTRLSWDFTAFGIISPKEYADQFSTFFKSKSISLPECTAALFSKSSPTAATSAATEENEKPTISENSENAKH